MRRAGPCRPHLQLSITFTPSTTGSRPATLTIKSDATNGPLVISLTGAGVILPEPVVTGPSSDFPDTVINQVSAQTRTITINNPRTNAIVYSVAAITDFSIDAESCPTRNVIGGGSCTLTITFRPLLGAGETLRTGSYAFSFTGTSATWTRARSTFPSPATRCCRWPSRRRASTSRPWSARRRRRRCC